MNQTTHVCLHEIFILIGAGKTFRGHESSRCGAQGKAPEGFRNEAHLPRGYSTRTVEILRSVRVFRGADSRVNDGLEVFFD